MSLQISHDCWSSSYSTFNSFRRDICIAAGYPLWDELLRDIKLWTQVSSDLEPLLNHSDCDGEISWHDCEALAQALEQLLDKEPIKGHWVTQTKQFIKGLRRAHVEQQSIHFT